MSRTVAVLVALLGCSSGSAAPLDAAESPRIVADATGVWLDECGGADAPAAHLAIGDLDAKLKELQASTACAPVGSDLLWPQGRRIGVTAYGVSTPQDAPKIEKNRVDARAIVVARGLEVIDLPT